MRLFATLYASLILFGILLVSASSAAQETKPEAWPEAWKFGINSRFRWEDSNQPHLSTNRQFSSIRVRPSLTFTGIEGLRMFIEPQYNKIFGLQSGTVDSSGNANYAGTVDTVYMRNAYMDLNIHKDFSFIAGRQDLAYGDQYIIGTSDWGPYGRSFDAIRLRYKTEGVFADLFQAKIVDANATATNNGNDKDLIGFYGSLSPNSHLRAIDLYGFYSTDGQKQNAATTDTTRPWHFGVYGTRLVSEFGSWDWKIEFAQNFGDEKTSALDSNSDNYMVDTQVDYRFGASHKHTIGLQLFSAGPHWRDLYPSTHGSLGRTDVLGRRNLTGAGLRWNTSWADRFVTALDLFAFNRTHESQSAFQADSKTPLAAGPSNSKELGYEIDLNIKKPLNQNLSLGAGINFFMYGPYLERQGGGHTSHYGYFMIEARH